MCGFFCIIGKNISKIVSDREILSVGKNIYRGLTHKNIILKMNLNVILEDYPSQI